MDVNPAPKETQDVHVVNDYQIRPPPAPIVALQYDLQWRCPIFDFRSVVQDIKRDLTDMKARMKEQVKFMENQRVLLAQIKREQDEDREKMKDMFNNLALKVDTLATKASVQHLASEKRSLKRILAVEIDTKVTQAVHETITKKNRNNNQSENDLA